MNFIRANSFISVTLLLVARISCLEVKLSFTRSQAEAEILFEYFHGENDGFYVDIGAFHPVDRSNTLMMKNQGWKGINIDGNYERIKYFFGMNEEDLNLNYAMGAGSSAFVEMFIPKSPLASTVLQETRPQDPKEEAIIRIPTISLSELCEFYFFRKPLFLNVDVEGVQMAVLKNNKWRNDRCRPQTILVESERWEATDSEGLRNWLESQGYSAVKKAAKNWLFIERNSLSKYAESSFRNSALLSENRIKIQKFNETIDRLAAIAPAFKGLNSINYDVFIAPAYLFFAIHGAILDLETVIRSANKIAASEQLKRRPIVVYNFDHLEEAVVVSGEYELQQLQVGQGDRYFLIKGRRQDIYIYNHQKPSSGRLRIIHSADKQ